MSVARTLAEGSFTSVSVANAVGTGGVDFTLTAVVRATGVSHSLTIGSGSAAYTSFQQATPAGVYFRLWDRVPTATVTPLTEVVVSATVGLDPNDSVLLKLLRPATDFVWQSAPVQNGTDYFSGLLVAAEEQTAGTNGGTFTSGAWQTRTINTLIENGFGLLSGNQITVPPGTYRLTASAPAFRVADHQARLQNITAGTTIQQGTSERSAATTGFFTAPDAAQSRSFIEAYFVVTSETILEIQHQCGTTFATTGFGNAGGFGTEVYTQVWIERIEDTGGA